MLSKTNVMTGIINNLSPLDQFHELNPDLSLSSDAAYFINCFDLKPHPEGGYFSQIYKSTNFVKSTNPDNYGNDIRSAGTSIYYLLNKKDFSAWHRLKSDEIWHYYRGSAVRIHIIDKQSNLKSYVLGDPLKISQAVFQIIVPADTWFAAELLDMDLYCLIGCTVHPGFENVDFELADRELLIQEFPQYESIITQFTR